MAIDAVSAEAWLAMEPSDKVTPEVEFDRQWARGILRQAKNDLEKAYAAADTSAVFEAFANQLDDGAKDGSYREIAAELGVAESQARFMGFKFRQRFRTRLLEIVTETVATPNDAAEVLDESRRGCGRLGMRDSATLKRSALRHSGLHRTLTPASLLVRFDLILDR